MPDSPDRVTSAASGDAGKSRTPQEAVAPGIHGSEAFAWGGSVWKTVFVEGPLASPAPEGAVELKEEGGEGTFMLVPAE